MSIADAIRTSVTSAESTGMSDPDLSSSGDSSAEATSPDTAVDATVADGGDDAVDTAAAGSEGESTTRPAADAAPVAEVDPKTGKPKAAAKSEEVDEFAKEHGLKPKKVDGRDNPIPYSAVRDRIVPNAVKKAQAKWETETLTPVKNENQVLRQQLTKVGETEDILFNQPDRFVGILKTIPGYEQYDFVKKGERPAEPAQRESAVPADDADLGPMPAPDWKGTNGETGYTPEQHQKMLEWRDEKNYRRAVRDAEARLSKRYEPIEKAFKSTTERRAASARLAEATTNLVTEFQDMPGFMDNYKEIEAALPKQPERHPDGKPVTPRQALKMAYETVVFPKLRQTEDQLRAKWLKELEDGGTATAEPGAAAVSRDTSAAPAGVDPINWAIRKATGIKGR